MRARRVLGEESGQMVVELAVVLPVALAVAVVGYNLARYAEACVVFDRMARDAVLAQGTSPAGEQTELSGVASVEDALRESMGGMTSCEVSARVEAMTGPGSATFSLVPSLERYTCTLAYRPWPSHLVIAGVDCEVPLVMTHEATIVADRYRPGLVM